MKRTELRRVSKRRAAENRLRRQVVREAWPDGRPPCALCGPLREHGITTGCDGWADDVDEVLRRSAQGSIVDIENLRPVGRRCHIWGTEHPREMRAWGLERSRWGAA